MHAERLARVRKAMDAQGVDVVLLSVGPDLPWLVGYEAMPLERLTMLVVPRDGEATLVIPQLEAPRVQERPDVFRVLTFTEGDDPVARVADLAGAASTVAIGDRTWARFVVDLQTALPGSSWRRASTITGRLRAVKDAAEIVALRRAAEGADRVAAQLQGGDIALVGRTEAEVSADIGRRLIDEGHQRVNFAIVAAGANAASPHHDASSRVIEHGDVVLCDFGGTMAVDGGVGYCSDITRCVSIGEPSPDVVHAYGVLHRAQAMSVASAVVGTPCEEVDAAARRIIDEAGYGERFFHRVGHGIGVEEHEDPYMVAGNTTCLVPGHAFSVEPGIYTAGAWGLRLEDIVVATADGPDSLNRADHALVILDR